jgi:anti-sigma factor RsiW
MEPSLSCREFVEFLADYLAGGLPQERLDAFNAHLAACPSCASYMRSYLEAVRLGRLAARYGQPAPEDVPAELIRAILAARRA